MVEARPPWSLVNLRMLKSTSLQGRIPPELAKLTFLEEIDLTRNYLSGELPKEWGSLQHLKRLSVTAIGTSGKIPKEWGNLANLNFLSLESNQLSGTIPEELGNLVNLTELALSSNQFVGNLPATFARLTNLINFRISDNNFKGTVPEFIGRWTKLERLEMQSSGLKGPINATIFALEYLKDLKITDMSGPKFDFPKLVSKQMNVLVLRNLNMSGSIPIDIRDIREAGSMNTLDLSFNKLEGEIMDYEAVNMFLSGNMLTGAIPNSMFHSTKNNIDLSYNNFTAPTSCPKSSTTSSINIYRSFSWEHNMSGLLPCPGGSSCQKIDFYSKRLEKAKQTRQPKQPPDLTRVQKQKRHKATQNQAQQLQTEGKQKHPTTKPEMQNPPRNSSNSPKANKNKRPNTTTEEKPEQLRKH